MSTILVLNSSALGSGSVTRTLVEETVNRLTEGQPNLRVLTRDLNENPIPHLSADAVQGIRYAEPANNAQATAQALSNELIAELRAADTIVIGAPMYNFGIPSTLKAWFDYVLRAGETFRYTADGPEGLLKGKRAIVIQARGGLYSEGPAQVMDSQEPHIRTLLGLIGITDVAYIRAEKLAFGPEARDVAISGARTEIERVLQDGFRLVA